MSLKPCYFCDVLDWYPGAFLIQFDDIYVCYGCYSFRLCINYDNQENDICGVCFEDTTLVTLPCSHKLCLQCCKIIYFGIATTEKPIDVKEMGIEPTFLYEVKHEHVKYDEYQKFRTQWFDMDDSYEKIIEIRNSLLSKRPDWMNTDTFLKYENELLKYHSECTKLEKEWEKYEYDKFKGNGTCPFCQICK